MQEIMKDGSEGEVIVEDTLEDLLPHIRKSLDNPQVNFVKVFKGTKVVPSNVGPPFEEKETFVAGEEKKDLLDGIFEVQEKFKRKVRSKKVAKTSNLLYPITVLEAERDNIHGLPGSQVAQLNKAIDMLNNERSKIEKKAFEDEMGIKEKEKVGVVDEHLFKRRKE